MKTEKNSGVLFDHHQNRQTVTGARRVLEVLFKEFRPASILDVGCGTGTWLRAAHELGVEVEMGIDGVEIPRQEVLFPYENFRCIDLTGPWSLAQKFDLVLCLEVAEHLPSTAAEGLVRQLTRHADTILFSAACPFQPGQHHIHCQWPVFWQGLFNAEGYACDDSIRNQVWNDAGIEPWYRQNMFIARRDSGQAGHEPRLESRVHPAFLSEILEEHRAVVEAEMGQRLSEGSASTGFYLRLPFLVFWRKFQRQLKG